MTGRKRIQLRQLLALIVAWQLAALLVCVYDHFVMHAVFVSIHEESYSFPAYIMFNMVAALLGSLISGPLIIFWVNEKFLNKPYGISILLVVFFFLTITIFLILLMGIFYISYTTGISLGEDGFWEHYNAYIFSLFQLKKLLVWSVIVALTQLALQMDRKFSHGVLWKIILGKYHLPKEENRIFMFADLSGSTTIAEAIGDKKYHLLLRDFFSDVTNAIINNNGSIYQYVGDQVIVSWKIERNGTANYCLQCFFDMKKSIEDKKETYMKNYGLIPLFKAGIHLGKVIAGEIGIIKRDITYSGDVLNTTSRIQDKCGELDVNLLVSDDLLEVIALQSGFISKYMGCIKLKGKKKEIGLNAIFVSPAFEE
jgi:adenylate cyclase